MFGLTKKEKNGSLAEAAANSYDEDMMRLLKGGAQMTRAAFLRQLADRRSDDVRFKEQILNLAIENQLLDDGKSPASQPMVATAVLSGYTDIALWLMKAGESPLVKANAGGYGNNPGEVDAVQAALVKDNKKFLAAVAAETNFIGQHAQPERNLLLALMYADKAAEFIPNFLAVVNDLKKPVENMPTFWVAAVFGGKLEFIQKELMGKSELDKNAICDLYYSPGEYRTETFKVSAIGCAVYNAMMKGKDVHKRTLALLLQDQDCDLSLVQPQIGSSYSSLTAFDYALKQSSLEIATMFLDSGRVWYPEDDKSCLVKACGIALDKKNWDFVKKVMARGIGMEDFDEYGNTLFMKAVRCNAPKEILQAMVDAGADVHARNSKDGISVYGMARKENAKDALAFLEPSVAEEDRHDLQAADDMRWSKLGNMMIQAKSTSDDSLRMVFNFFTGQLVTETKTGVAQISLREVENQGAVTLARQKLISMGGSPPPVSAAPRVKKIIGNDLGA